MALFRKHRTTTDRPFGPFAASSDFSETDRFTGQHVPPAARPMRLLAASVQPVVEQLENRQMFSVPNAPFAASAAAASANVVNVAWYDNSWDESGFTVERRAWSGNYQAIATVGAGATSYADTSAQPSTQYTYRISAFSGGGSSNVTESNSTTTGAGTVTSVATTPSTGNAWVVPNGPFSLSTAAASSSSINLSWYSNSNNESGFKIERSTDGYTFTQVGTTGVNTTTYTDTGLAGGTTYTYRVAAYNAAGNSGYAGPSAATTSGSYSPAPTPTPTPTSTASNVNRGAYWIVPNGPFGLAVAASGTTINLQWSINSSNESGFKIERSTDGYNFTQVGTSAAGVGSYSDSGLSAGTTYTYRIAAYNVTGASSYAGPLAATTGGSYSPSPTPTPTPTPTTTGSTVQRGAYWTVPNGPFGLAVTSTGSAAIISWHVNSDNESGFRVERTTDGYNYTLLGTAGAGVGTVTDTSVTPGVTYAYRVSAYNQTGASSYAGPAQVTIGTAAPSAPSVPTPTPTPTPTATAVDTSGFFPIGVYRQPTSTFPTWKARGINTVIDFYTRSDWMEAWNQAAVANQLWMIRNPRANISADVNQPYLLAYEHDDEPDIQGEPTSQLAAEYAYWKSANPKIPVVVNVAGANAQYKLDGLTDDYYRGVFATADWISSDTYPISAWSHPQWIDKAIPMQTDRWDLSNLPFTPGNAVDAIRTLSGGKKQFAYIETSWQNLTQDNAIGSRAPTGDEVRGEIWDSIVHGAKGIVYFPFTFPSNNDGTPADVAASITATDAKITSLAAVINTGNDATNNYINLPGGLEATVRYYGGHAYYFVLNFSHTATSTTFNLPGAASGTATVVGEGRTVYSSGGNVSDSFGAYSIHVYQL